jgi:hypothetical protein
MTKIAKAQTPTPVPAKIQQRKEPPIFFETFEQPNNYRPKQAPPTWIGAGKGWLTGKAGR